MRNILIVIFVNIHFGGLFSLLDEELKIRSERFNRMAIDLLNAYSGEKHVSLNDIGSLEAFRKLLIGCWDTDLVLPALAVVGKTNKRTKLGGKPLVFVDGGANIGKITGSIFSLFGNIPFRAFSFYSEEGLIVNRWTNGVTCPERVDTLETVVISVEPQPSNYQRLLKNAQLNYWTLDGFFPVNKALTNKAGDWVHLEHSCSNRIDEVAHVVNESITPGFCHSKVETTSVSSLLDDLEVGDWSFRKGSNQVFLLKLDIEGEEPSVLASIGEELLQGTIKFITFEFISDWKSPEGLGKVLSDLWKIRFFCFLILPEQLVPVSGPYWNPLAQKHWTNFLCGLIDDSDLVKVVNIHNAIFDSDWNSFRNEYMREYVR